MLGHLSPNIRPVAQARLPRNISCVGPPPLGAQTTMWFASSPALAGRSPMTMVCGLDLHRQQITFDAMDTESGEVWRGRLWQPDRQRFRRWLHEDVAAKGKGAPVKIAVEGCTGWRYVVEEIVAAGFEAHL